MGKPLRVLLVEDSEDDVALLLDELTRGGFEPAYVCVDTPAAMSAALAREPWDIILSDYSMPHFSAPRPSQNFFRNYFPRTGFT